MSSRLSKSQIEALGKRLVSTEQIEVTDLDSFREVLNDYSDALGIAVTRARAVLDVSPTSRIKSLGTTLEKLERNNGSGLKSMQDLAGMRIVDGISRTQQDELVSSLVALFSEEAKPPKVIDRRSNPSHGYRAVHIIVFPDDIPVEIQVRTVLQHEWANMFEKLADVVGRGIRYGEKPSHLLSTDNFESLSASEKDAYEELYQRQIQVVEIAQLIAETISELEAFEQLHRGRHDISEIVPELAQALESFQVAVAEMLQP